VIWLKISTVFWLGAEKVSFIKGDLVKDFNSILARRRNHFSQLFNVHGISDVRQKYTQQNH